MCPLFAFVVLFICLPCSCLGWISGDGNSVKSQSRRNLLLMTSSTEQEPSGVFPMSTRQALINKAKSLDSALETQGKGSYSAVGWSNRLGTALTPASIPGVYTADRPFYWNSIDVGCRMTVVVLDENQLWIHSPVGLDGPLQRALESLGTVAHVVSPNYEHVKFAKQWADAYPNAKMWACPGLMERMPDVRWDGEVPYGIRPNDDSPLPDGFWDVQQIQPLHSDCEVNPFTGKPFFNEVVFFHTPSKTLITTDLFWNYPKGDGITNSNFNNLEEKNQDLGVWELAPSVDKVQFGSRLWKIGMDKVFRPFYMNLMIKGDKKGDFQELSSFICGQKEGSWDVETVIPAHGDIIRGNTLVKAILKDHFNLQ